ncbi:MAG: hypothetical protein JOS17DRAFT_826735 [Linnemannia elongata]|nr:MAG: hypothetical protein JOS17DRAFT_826735 [Linnemannia elongata]
METFPSQNSLWAENDDEYAITQCHHCQDRFPARGINRLLPVPIGFLGDRVCEAFLCLDCRRRHFETHKQPYKTAVGAYQYPGFGSDIIPWITESEAKVQYCLDDSHLEPLQNVIIRPVQAAGKVQQIKMFYEKSILDKPTVSPMSTEIKTTTTCEVCSTRKKFDIQKEPFPPNIAPYLDPTTRTTIVPRITETEATAYYCLDDGCLKHMGHIYARSVGSIHPPYKVKLYKEHAVLYKARSFYGGDVGIASAREVLALEREGRINLPPVGVIRERRNRIRQAFLEKGFYASSKLPPVSHYLRTGRGDLQEIVNNFAV